jgi:type III restriction enzyme
MEFKDYQQTVLDTLDAYLSELITERARSQEIAKLAAAQPNLGLIVPDFPSEAWKTLKSMARLPSSRKAFDYSPRTAGTGQAVPNVCFKIPTGGGKTLVATASISRVLGQYLSSNTGFVLWIVPNEAIYTQTKRQLANRDHPYRQMLERAGAGRVKILEKTSRLDSRDIANNLCVMLLMLQSANRSAKETLRLFRDRGNVHGFFPPADDFLAHHQLMQDISNLSAYADQDPRNLGSIVQDSLGNVLRFIRPVVVMDEGHRAYSKTALGTVYGFNPSFVIELSATPKDRPNDRPPRYANWLVDVRGKDLADEDMIKLPINVKVKSSDDWRDCLREGLELLNGLQVAADELRANTNRYIRPMMLVQVERTGRDQREAGFIHAEDAKEFLLTAGFHEREVAIKTSEVNDLSAPENQDLLSPTNSVRVVITKQALQEGWDCPFAYVLCSLSANRNMRAMTQLVGRILRQPYASKTSIRELDECYVLCHHAATREVVAGIKQGLEEDGMADLAQQIKDSGVGNGAGKIVRKIKRRPPLKSLEIFLPVVNWVIDDEVRKLDYERDVLLRLDWSSMTVNELAKKIPDDGSHVVASQMTQISLADGAEGEFFPTAETRKLDEAARFDPVYATRMINDIVPNPWIGRKLIGDLITLLKGRGFDEVKLGGMSSFIIEELRKFLIKERDSLAEASFVSDVATEHIQFRLRTDTHNWKMPTEMETDLPEASIQLIRPDGVASEKSVFAPVYRVDFNKDEADFACYIDEQKALQWWHRNVAKAGHYHVQGWRKHKVYPDFIFALTPGGEKQRLVVIETKGNQFEGNLDTEYKRKLLKLVTENYKFQKVVKAGELELVIDGETTLECDLVLIDEWKTRIPNEYFGT